jgi:hypothetical protein
MRLDIDTEIRFPSGERAGILRKVILNEDEEVTGVVMATDELVPRDLVVPVNLLSEGMGGVLNINIEPQQLDSLPEYQEELLPAVPEGWQFPDQPLPGLDVFPATMYQPIIPVVEADNVPGDINLTQGTEVACLDGRWGIVDEVLVDHTGKAYAFVARPDDIEEHDRVVPLALVRELTSDRVLLNCTLAELPAYTRETTNELEEPEPE